MNTDGAHPVYGCVVVRAARWYSALRDLEQAIGDMLGAGGSLGARILGAEAAIGFAPAA